MKSQIFAGIALLIAGVYTVEVNKAREPKIEAIETRVFTMEEIIQQSSLEHLKKEIKEQEEYTSCLIRETVEDKVIDSIIKPVEHPIIK